MQINSSTTGIHVQTGVRIGMATVYGATNDAATEYTLAGLDARRIPYQFVNCALQSCPQIVKANPYPTVTGYPGTKDQWNGLCPSFNPNTPTSQL